jgi:predicted RecB family nuclease
MTAITHEDFEACLKCQRRSHLISVGAVGAESRFHEWQRRSQEQYEEAASANIRNSIQTNDWCIGAPRSRPFPEHPYRVIFDYAVAEPDVHARLHALELHREGARMGRHSYYPIRFVPREKLTGFDKLLLAFDAFAFSRATGKLPAFGKIVHGRRYLAVRVPLGKLYGEVRRVIAKIVDERAESMIPPVVLNKHCAECQFQAQCDKIAREKDNLSLLATISDKERKKFHEKGIFTVTQLSHSFRPRKGSAARASKHFPALKALAIRENKIHVLGTPTMNGCGTPVYLDVEGDLDRDFYYLIGMRTRNGVATAQYSFWADDPVAK